MRYLADQVVVMYLGQVMESGPVAALFDPPYHPYTEALLSAVPVPDPTLEQSASACEGEIPSPLNVPPGCRFAGRCPRKVGAVCDQRPPPARRGRRRAPHPLPYSASERCDRWSRCFSPQNRNAMSGGLHTSRIRPESRRPSEIGWEAAPIDRALMTRLAEIDQVALRRFRLERLREALRKLDVAGALLADPMNIRYATGTRNMAVWTLHAPGRYVFVATEGPLVLFEFSTTRHLAAGFETVDELRDSMPWFYFAAGPRQDEKVALWAEEVASLVATHGGGNRRLAVDRCDPAGTLRLHARGIELIDVQGPIEHGPPHQVAGRDHSACRPRWTCATSPSGACSEALRPGITENQLWAHPARDQCRAWRRVDRMPAARLRPAHQSRGSRNARTGRSSPATSSASTPTWSARTATSPTSPAP